MESLFRRKKLPSFSDYDGVFSKTGSPAKSRTEDYREIFGGSKCSIPVLDLSALDEVADDVARGRGKDVEYSKIFGGGGGDVAGSYEEVFAQQRTPAKKVSRADKSTPRYKKEEEYHHETPNQAPEGIKQYSTFYNRTSQGSKDGENGTTTHVAHIRAVPGFTCFVDENTQKTKIDNLGPLPKDKIQPTTRVSVDFEKKQTTDSAGKLKREPIWDKLYSPDRNVTSSFKMSSPTRVPASTASETKKSRELNFNIPKMGAEKSASDNISPSFSDEELDVNSTAAVSAAALRKAVMEAEGMIRLAKEIMERKKNGIQKIPRVKKKILERASIQPTKNENVLSKLKVFNEVKIACEGVRETNDAKSNSYDDVQEHDAKLERKKARKSGKSSPSLVQSSEYCVVQNVCVKVNEKTAEASADLKETLEKDDLKTITVELEQPRGSTMRLFMKNLFGKGNDNKLPEVTKENQKKEDLEMGDTNGCNFVLSACNISENVDQDMLEPCADSKPLVMVPESVSIENEKTENLKVDHENDNNVLASVHDVCGKVKEDEVGLSADFKAPGCTNESYVMPSGHNFSENLKVEHENDNNVLASVHDLCGKVKEDEVGLSADSKAPGCTNESYVMPSGHNFSEKENDKILKTFVDPEELPEMVKTDNRRTGEIKSCVDSFSDKTNVEMLETSSKLVKTDDLSTEIFGLEHENGSNIIPTVDNGPKIVNEIKPSIEIKSCVDSFSDKTNVEILETSSRLVKTDDLRTEIFGLEHKNGSNITPTVENGPKIVNRNNLSIESASSRLVKTDDLRTEIFGLEHKNGSNITPTVENGPKIVNRNNLSIESVNMDSQENATLESRDRYGGEIVPPAEHANECTEMEKQTEDGTLELLEKQGKEVHRKRKQWKDFEGKPDEIKIAEDEGHSSQISIVQEPLDKNKEYRKRRQWKDVEVKSYGIKIAVDGETSIHELKTSFSEEEAVKSHERESVSGESLNVNINHGEELDEAQKRVENDNRKECSLEPGIATLSTGVHENRGSVAHVCKEDEIEKKVLESAEWRAYEMASEVESNESGQNDDKDGSEDLGDGEVAHIYEGDDSHMSFEESERMSDASQSSIDFKEGFIFEEELGETSEVFQSCEFDGFETGSSYVEMVKDQNTIYINSILETAVSSDNDSGDKQTELDETGYKLASKSVEMESRIEASELPNLFIGEQKMRGVYEQEWVTMINSKREEEKMKGTDEETAKESREREVRAEKEELERNDEITKREREREKNRMVVERAIREARERAFAEARERAERAAVEKATAEARERVMAEARQKFEKTNSANKSSTEKVNLQTKLRSERAAVERAHAEARERALEKALSQKSIFPSSKLDGNNGESVERRNARLEKTQRTMERAAKALAEKNMRDLRAQREQAERHRLAETLDAEIKRWSSGKTGNLRALLSTLQYILGSDSGWVPVSLTEIVSTSAVKKAYRKATLHVHPDKLQQRGATTQQKYICEKVFDLLKAAWNRFNSEER